MCIIEACVLFLQHSELCCRSEPWGRNSVLCHLPALTPSSLHRRQTQRNTRWDRAENKSGHRPIESPGKLTSSVSSSVLQASEHIPPGYEVVSLLEALNGPLNTSSVAPAPLHSGPSHVTGALPPYSSEPHPAPARSLSPLDHSNSSQGLKLKKSGSKWVRSQMWERRFK